MIKEDIIDSDIYLLKENSYYLFYEMMINSLKEEDIIENLSYSLSLLRAYLNSGYISLFRKNDNGLYTFKDSDIQIDELAEMVKCVVNKAIPISVEKKLINCNYSKNFKNLFLLQISVGNNNTDNFILAILNIQDNINYNSQFWNDLKNTLSVILKRAISYEKSMNDINTDSLTGFDNRNSYERRLQRFDNNSDDIVIALFDLFRLKFFNDNYTHEFGDLYIKEVSRILKKYWPKYTVSADKSGKEKKIETGHCIYRIGGDEFILLTTADNVKIAGIKANLASKEISTINLGIDSQNQFGINYGIVKHIPGERFQDTFMYADKLMENNKLQMYRRLHLERRT